MKNTNKFYYKISKTLVLACGFICLLVSCENTLDTDETENIEDIVVVEAFLDPNKEITVKLSKMIPFLEDESSDDLSIENADVYIINNDNEYLLTAGTDEAGMYTNTNPELTLTANETYELKFTYNDILVSSSTTIPSPPENPSLSSNQIEIAAFVPGPPSATTSETITVNWNNTNNDYFIILIEYLETDYDPINSFLSTDNYDQLRITSTDPINVESIDLNSRNFSFYGTHRITIYTINSEYVNLYENISQNSLNLTEPLTNIENGVGIFTGMNPISLTLEVVPLN